MARKIIKLIAPFLWAGFIFYLSSIPSLRSPFGIWDLYLRKIAHITEYFILILLIFNNFSQKDLKARIISLLVAGLYAVTDEYHQKFVPGRHMELFDMIWDWIGCLGGYFIMMLKYNEKG